MFTLQNLFSTLVKTNFTPKTEIYFYDEVKKERFLVTNLVTTECECCGDSVMIFEGRGFDNEQNI